MPVLVERPSLFSDSGNRLPLFNPFAAALSSLSPAERYEAEFMGLLISDSESECRVAKSL